MQYSTVQYRTEQNKRIGCIVAMVRTVYGSRSEVEHRMHGEGNTIT
jgi:hypothetical protein